MDPAHNVLSDQHYEILNKVCQSCSITDELAGKCQACGLDVSELMERNAQQRQLAENLKKTFFPHRT